MVGGRGGDGRIGAEIMGATTFHFLDASPADALRAAREAADAPSGVTHVTFTRA